MSASNEWMAAVAATLNAQPSGSATDDPEPQASVAVSESESVSSSEPSHNDEVSSASAAVDEQLDGPAGSPVNDMADIFESAAPSTTEAVTGPAAAGLPPASQSTVGAPENHSAPVPAATAPLAAPPSAAVSLLDVFAGDDLEGENPGTTLTSDPIFDPFGPGPATPERASTTPQETDEPLVQPQRSPEATTSRISFDVFDPFVDDEAVSPAASSVAASPEQPHEPATGHEEALPAEEMGSAPEEAVDVVDPDSQPERDNNPVETSMVPEARVSSMLNEEPGEKRTSPLPLAVEPSSLNDLSSGAVAGATSDMAATAAAYTPRRARAVAADGSAGALPTPGDASALAAGNAERLSVLAAHLGLTDAEALSLAIRTLAVAHRLHI